jgi:hypothetical protein
VTNLKKREKILAALAGGLVLAVIAGVLLFTGDGRPGGQLRGERDRLAAEVEKKQGKLDAARRSAEQLAAWERRALPTDATSARSLYQNWLRGLADRVRLRQVKLDSGEAQSRRNMYTLFSFTVRGRATLLQLARFLHEFYAAGHLHQVRRLDMKPVEGSSDLDVTLNIEALSLPGADRAEKLSQEPGTWLKLVQLSDYNLIAQRNLFSPPASARTGPPPSPPSLDAAQFTFVTAIIKDVDGQTQVWLVDRMAGKTLKLNQGERFQIGPVQGRVAQIGTDDVVVELDGRSRRLRLGDHLRGGITL